MHRELSEIFYYNLFSRIKGTKTKKSTDFFTLIKIQVCGLWDILFHSFFFFLFFGVIFCTSCLILLYLIMMCTCRKFGTMMWRRRANDEKCKKISPSQKKHTLYLAKPWLITPLNFKIQSKRLWKDIEKTSTFDDFSLCFWFLSCVFRFLSSET